MAAVKNYTTNPLTNPLVKSVQGAVPAPVRGKAVPKKQTRTKKQNKDKIFWVNTEKT